MLNFAAIITVLVCVLGSEERWICNVNSETGGAFLMWFYNDQELSNANRTENKQQAVRYDLSVLVHTRGTNPSVADSRAWFGITRLTLPGVETFGAGFFPKDLQLVIRW
jgi:hypothetical protein